MALASNLFRGDPNLEAAAVSDRAHILPGATGAHVGKIQLALVKLDGADIDQDGSYGPETAAAVLAYKRKRNIINRSYQTQADDIVGRMTMAALDSEMLALENVSTGPVRIRALSPAISGPAAQAQIAGRSTLLLGFKIDVAVPVNPSGNISKIRLVPRSTGRLEIIDGISGRVVCRNMGPEGGDCDDKTCWIFDPADPGLVPAIRLNPEPQGPMGATGGIRDGGTVRVARDPHTVSVDAFRPGNSFVDASTATAAATLFVEVRAPRLGIVAGVVPTKAEPGSKFLSAEKDGDPNPTGVFGGRPINPIGTGRKINLGGEQETPGFEDYSVNLPFSGYRRSWTNQKFLFRPWAEDPDPAIGVGSRTASDICIRGTPVKDDTILTIRRIAAPGCRLTCSSDTPSFTRIRAEFPFQILEEFPQKGNIVIQFP